MLGLGLATVVGAVVSAGVLATASCAGRWGEACLWARTLGPVLVSVPLGHVGSALVATGGSVVRYGQRRIEESAGP